MAAHFNDPKSKEQTKCAVKMINLDKHGENIQAIAQVRTGAPQGLVYFSPNLQFINLAKITLLSR